MLEYNEITLRKVILMDGEHGWSLLP
jgi:hypothetical protein